MKKLLLTFAFLTMVFGPIATSAQALKSLDDFDPDLYLNLDACFEGSLSENLACLEQAVSTCSGFTSHLGTAGGAYVCSSAAFDIVDSQLNRIYPAYVAAAGNNAWGESRRAESEQELRAAQRAWINYRDATCTIAPNWNGINSGYGSVVANCQSRLTLMQMTTLSIELAQFAMRQ